MKTNAHANLHATPKTANSAPLLAWLMLCFGGTLHITGVAIPVVQ